MALTKAQVSLVTVATLGITPGAYLAQLEAFNTQKEAAAFIATTGLLNEGTNAEYALQVVKNLGAGSAADLYKALEAGASRADATVDFANAVLVAANGNLASVNKAKASTSTSADLAVLKAELSDPATDGLRVKFNDTNTDQSSSVTGGHTVNNIGKAQIDAGQGKISVDYTFELKNQIGEGATFTGNFLSPILDERPPETSGSQVVLELRNLREDENSVTPLKDLPTNGFGFEIDGELVMVQSDSIDDAETYADLLAAIQARVTELASGQNLPDGADAALYAKLATFTVEFGNTKFAEERDTNGNITKTHDVQVTEIILKDEAGATLNPRGYTNRDGIIDSSGFTLFAQMSDESGTSIQHKIATNLEADNVGYGSQGATVNLVGQSNSDKGIQELNVTANNNVWFTKLESQKNANTIDHLEIINLVAGSSDYFRVGTQKNDPTHLAALVDEDFANAGLVDVQQLNAGNAGSVAVNSYITDAVINRFDLEDTGLYTTDDNDALIQYNLTSGSDVLQLKIDSEVVAYADTKVNISTGGGNDFVHLQIDQGNSYGDTWLVNQQLNDNIKIEAASGNNTIWTEGAGNANITTGTGNDKILADNSGKQAVDATTDVDTAKAIDKLYAMGATVEGYVKAGGVVTAGTTGLNGLFVMNTETLDLADLVSSSDETLGGTPPDGVAQSFQTFKNKVSVSFLGFESKFVEVKYDTSKYTTSTQQINQAIKDAINNDDTLSKLVVAKEFPGNVLVIESLIDGVRTATDLTLTFEQPLAVAAPAEAGKLQLTANELLAADKAYGVADGTTNLAALTDLQTITGNGLQYANDEFVQVGAGPVDVTGAISLEESDNVINAGAGTDVVVLGTGALSNDTVVLSGNFGKTTIVNFDSTAAAPATGGDILDFTSYLVNTLDAANASETVTIETAGAGAKLDDAISVLDFSILEVGTASGIDNTTTNLSNVTAAQLQVEMNNGGLISGVVADKSEHVFMIHNNSTLGGGNVGEYLVVSGTTVAGSSDLKLTIVGTLDFGTDAAGLSNFDATTAVVADFA